MGRELGRFLEHRRTALGLSRRDLAERSGLSYPYVSQLETGDREPALKAVRALAPALEVPLDELAALVAGGQWATTADLPPASPVVMTSGAAARPTTSPGPLNRDKLVLHLERRLRGVPPLERIAVLHELLGHAVEELRQQQG